MLLVEECNQVSGDLVSRDGGPVLGVQLSQVWGIQREHQKQEEIFQRHKDLIKAEHSSDMHGACDPAGLGFQVCT